MIVAMILSNFNEIDKNLFEVKDQKETWVRIQSTGPSDKPLPIIYISDHEIDIERGGFQTNIVVSESAYKNILNMSYEYRCDRRRPDKWFTEFGALEIAVSHQGNRQVVCVAAPEISCAYLRGLLPLIDLPDADTRRYPVEELGRRFGCKGFE